MADNYKVTQFIKNNFKISSIIKEEFLQSFRDAFNVDDVESINIAFKIQEGNDVLDIVTFTHRFPGDEISGKLLIDLNDEESFDKIKKVLDNY